MTTAIIVILVVLVVIQTIAGVIQMGLIERLTTQNKRLIALVEAHEAPWQWEKLSDNGEGP